MRRFSARMFPNAVTAYALQKAQDASGGRLKAFPANFAAGVDLQASVQLLDARRKGSYQGATYAGVDGVAFFPADPGLKVDDRLVWHAPSGDRSYTVQGPATAPAGRDALYSVGLIEVR